MALAACARKQAGGSMQQPGEGFPVTAKPGEQNSSRAERRERRGSELSAATKHRGVLPRRFQSQKTESRGSQRREVKDRGLLACEHQRGARTASRPAERSGFGCAPTGQDQSKRGGDKKGLVNEIAVVVDGQGANGKQQRGDEAGHKAEDFGRRAKEQNRDGSGRTGSGAVLIR